MSRRVLVAEAQEEDKVYHLHFEQGEHGDRRREDVRIAELRRLYQGPARVRVQMGCLRSGIEKEDGGKRNKICFYSWAPDDAKIKHKMVFASSKDALRRSLVGIATEIQGTDFSEVAYEVVLDKASRGA
ncbi:Cofilin/tropomyosin-type actin-binding protein-domain-containing protein [Mycena sp. CBHHK59/15]|nr:Cofilin/tropomyosin-type actin-binding protein-domain-containing protein [Mycena sp. CBHHK59/15]